MPYRLIYVSRVARQVRFADVEEIAEISAKRNAAHEISGLLLYMPSHFVQVLEGPREQVMATFARISKDERHLDLRVALEGEGAERRFGNWAMTARLAPVGLEKRDVTRLTGAELEAILLDAR